MTQNMFEQAVAIDYNRLNNVDGRVLLKTLIKKNCHYVPELDTPDDEDNSEQPRIIKYFEDTARGIYVEVTGGQLTINQNTAEALSLMWGDDHLSQFGHDKNNNYTLWTPAYPITFIDTTQQRLLTFYDDGGEFYSSRVNNAATNTNYQKILKKFNL